MVGVYPTPLVKFCLLALAVLPLASCQQAAPQILRSESATALSQDEVRSTIWLGHHQEGGFAGYGSAVIVGEKQLLTNRHFWVQEDNWRSAPLPERATLALLGKQGDFLARDFRLIAAGEPGKQSSRKNAASQGRLNRSDWVLIETDAPIWSSNDIAPLHEPARIPQWQAVPGSQLFIAGFSSVFMPASLERNLPKDGELPSKTYGELVHFFESGPYLIEGPAKLVSGTAVMDFHVDSAVPLGHSGGGVYVWNSQNRRAELIGLFHSRVLTTETTEVKSKPLGLEILSSTKVQESSTAALCYAPLDALPL